MIGDRSSRLLLLGLFYGYIGILSSFFVFFLCFFRLNLEGKEGEGVWAGDAEAEVGAV